MRTIIKLAINLSGLLLIMGMVSYGAITNTQSVDSAFTLARTHIIPNISSLDTMKSAVFSVLSSTMEYIFLDHYGLEDDEELFEEQKLISSAIESFNSGYAKYRLEPSYDDGFDEEKMAPIIMENWNVFITNADKLRQIKTQGAGPEAIAAQKESFEASEMILLESIEKAIKAEEKEAAVWQAGSEKIVASNYRKMVILGILALVLAAFSIFQLIISLKERGEIESHLARTNRMWEMNFSAMNDGAAIADQSGKILKANPAFMGIIGKPADKVLGQNFGLLIREAGVDAPLRHGSTVETYAKKISIWLSISSSVSLDDKKRLIETMHIIRDITKLKKAEEALANRNDELEKFRQIVVERELRMIELKKQVKGAKKT